MLLKTKYLATLLNNPAMKATSEAILDEVWKEEGSIFSLIPEEHLLKCTWNDLKKKHMPCFPTSGDRSGTQFSKNFWITASKQNISGLISFV